MAKILKENLNLQCSGKKQKETFHNGVLYILNPTNP